MIGEEEEEELRGWPANFSSSAAKTHARAHTHAHTERERVREKIKKKERGKEREGFTGWANNPPRNIPTTRPLMCI